MSGVLSTGGFEKASMNDVLLQQIQTRAAKSLSEKQANIQERYTEKNNVVAARSDRLIQVKASINNAEIAVENGMDAVKEARQLLWNMANDLSDMAEDPEFYREQFDQKLYLLNDSMNKYEKKFNLVGNVQQTDWTPNEVEYRRDLDGGTTKMTGTFGGSDFYVVADDGAVWVPDLESDILEEYPTGFPGERSKNLVSTRVGLSVDSYDEATGAITLSMNMGETTKTVSGTLHKGGLEMMGSWYYNGFLDAGGNVDPDKIAAAREALNEAESRLDIVQGSLAINQGIVESDKIRNDEDMKLSQSERKDLLLSQLQEQSNLQTQYQQEYQAMVLNLSNMASQQQRYVDMFGATIQMNPLLSVDV